MAAGDYFYREGKLVQNYKKKLTSKSVDQCKHLPPKNLARRRLDDGSTTSRRQLDVEVVDLIFLTLATCIKASYMAQPCVEGNLTIPRHCLCLSFVLDGKFKVQNTPYKKLACLKRGRHFEIYDISTMFISGKLGLQCHISRLTLIRT